jgi:GTPase involved in cell partitioning and DNA repair
MVAQVASVFVVKNTFPKGGPDGGDGGHGGLGDFDGG